MREKSSLSLPYQDTKREIEVGNVLVILGANGAGKTRFGAWIDVNSPNKNKVHRISAQKSLAMPASSSTMSLEEAESRLLCGTKDGDEANRASHKVGSRWRGNTSVAMLNDFDQLMIYLYSEDYEVSVKYRQAKLAGHDIEVPRTKLDVIKSIWEAILPHRKLRIDGGAVKTEVSNDQVYNASEMSDGERVVLYLIGQCLASPKDGIFVIDEPELHLHKAIQYSLWISLEAARPDCLFVYITHDTEFASTRSSSVKIWLKKFDGKHWDWDVINPVNEIPESLLLEILGSRKPVVFVEGESSSWDTALYRAILGGSLVVPIGNCSQVIQSTKAFRANNPRHHLETYGIVDRDRRLDPEVAKLESEGICVLSVAEVENLFCVPEIVQIIASAMKKQPEVCLKDAEKFAIKSLRSELDNQVAMRCTEEIRFRLSLFGSTGKDGASVKSDFDGMIAGIDVAGLFADAKALFDLAISGNDYREVLKVYNRKSLASQISADLGLKKNGIAEWIINTAGNPTDPDRKQILDALRPYFGKFGHLLA